MIEPNHKKISVVRQCELLSLSRSSYYYVSGKDDGYNRILMNLIDEQYTRTPFYVERLWCSVKYEEVYLHQYTTVSEARHNLERYFHFYNTERPHQALDYRTPYELYFKEQPGCSEPKVALAY